ncbi:MAG TPA: hypothetical protein PKA88_30465, partial [Polyangiaceae bacterium]|nr:hypothetical protein [Polyangiaceae bacterium]
MLTRPVRTGLKALVLALSAWFVASSGCAASDLSDSLNSGECGPSGECAAGFVCNAANNQCVRAGSIDAGGDSSLACPGCDDTCCEGECVNLALSADNCGTCGLKCPGTTCQGSCTSSCAGSNANCNSNLADGCEVQTASDRLNCGACANACPDIDNGSPTCVIGTCGSECDPGFAECDGACVDTASDPLNCG